MATLKSGISPDLLTIDPLSKAARIAEYTPDGRNVSPQSKATFFAAGMFTPPATPTDMVIIYGSPSKIVKIISFRIGTTNTAAGSQQFFLIRRNSANTGGTFIPATIVPADSMDDASTVSTVGHYTANPTTLGIAVGTIQIKRLASPVAVPGSFAGVVHDASFELLDHMINSFIDKPVTLHGTSQGLCLNFGGAALVSGQTHIWRIVWTEE